MKLNTFQDFPDNRLTGDTSLRQLQLVMLRLLKIFDKICQENNLTYWIDAGTLLGAVRHNGFIPWDDDLDVIMPYEDYLKFLKLPATVFPEDVFLQTPTTDKDYICPWIKLRDRFSHIDEAGGPYPYSQAAFLDIFPALNMTENQHKYRSICTFLPPYNRSYDPIVKHLSLKSKIKNCILNCFYFFFKQIIKIKPIKNKLIKFFETGSKAWEYIPPIRWNHRFPENIIFPLKKIQFEDGEFYAPNNPHEYLKIYFGDYMTPPPESERKSNHFVTEIHPIGPNPHFSALKWEDYYTKEGIPL